HVRLDALSFDILSFSVAPRRTTKSPFEATVTEEQDKLSATLAKDEISGHEFKTGRIDLYKPGTTTPYQTYFLKRVLLTKFAVGQDQCGHDRPLDTEIGRAHV